MNLRASQTVTDRRKALEKEVGVDLKNISSFTLDEEAASRRNCENMIGAAQIPMGVAGPLKISLGARDKSGQPKEFYIPLATTEGALVASVNRGCKAIAESGGAAVDSHRVGATRGPVFKVNNLAESRKLYEFLDVHFNALAAAAERTSHHLTLTKVSSRGVGRYRYVRFVYDTHDAMGLNMVTIATDAAARLIEKETGAQCIALSGNFCVDKKPSWQNFINNRGMKVWAEVTLPASVLRDVLNSTAREVHEVWIAKCMIGSAMSGSMGCNAQYANVIAAMFLATGQDPAHVSECSVGITTCEVMNEHDLYVSVYLPDLMVGTVGGGTSLATQKEALSLLGVAGGTPAGEKGKNSQRFAEIVGAAVLAGEISLLASLEEGTLAKAHERLARGKG